MNKVHFVFLTLLLFSLASCKKFDPTWETEILTPLLRSSLSMKDLVRDSSLQANDKHELSLIYSRKLYDLSVDSVFTFSDTGVFRSFKIEVLSLYNTTFNYPISLGQICLNAGLVGLLIVAQNGNKVAIPAVPAIASPQLDLNADSIFTTMTLNSGSMDVSLNNNLPIDITDVNFELRNANNNDLIANGIFPLIPAGQSVSQSFSLAGKTVEGKLKAQLISLKSPGSNGVPVVIDTSNTIVASIRVYDLHPSTATALFPAQDLVNSSSKFIVRSLDVMLKDSRVNSGKIKLTLYSTLQDSVYFTYRLPSATINGNIFETSKTLGPAPKGGVSSYEQIIDITGYKLNLSGEHQDTVNTAFNEFKASVKYSGKLRTLSTLDSFYIRIDFYDIHPEYAIGYLGNRHFIFGPADQDFSFLKAIEGDLNIADAKFTVESENFIGVDAQLKLNQLSSINSRTGKTVDMTGQVLNSPLQIQRAKDNNGFMPIIPNYSQIIFDASNSNINPFISNLPDKLRYSIDLETNPNGNTSNYTDFIYDGHLLNLKFNLEVPLAFSGNNIQLSDTLDLDLSSINIEKVDQMELKLIANNGFPFDAKLQMYLLDNSNAVKDSLFTQNQIIAAAKLNSSNKVDTKERSILTIPLDRAKLNLLLSSKKIKASFILNTIPKSQIIKIFDDYNIDMVLTGRIKYIAE